MPCFRFVPFFSISNPFQIPTIIIFEICSTTSIDLFQLHHEIQDNVGKLSKFSNFEYLILISI